MRIADLGNEPDRAERVDPAQAPKPSNEWRPPLLDGVYLDQSVEAVATGEQHLVAADVLTEDGVCERLVEADLGQPLELAFRPRLAGPDPDVAATQQHL